MAILRGFPPSNMISSSVRIAEKDFSFVPAEQSFHRAGLVGFCSKGPTNVPTLINTTRQLHTIFGYPHPDVGDPYLIYAAEQYLLVATELYIVRVAQEDATNDEQAVVASKNIPAAGGVIRITSDTAGPYVFADDSFFRWKLNGNLSSKTLIVPEDTYTASALKDELNDQLSTQDGIEFYLTDDADPHIAVKTTFAYGPSSTLELISIQNAIYGGLVSEGNVTGLGTGMTQAETTGDTDRYPDVGYQTPGHYDFTGLSGLNLEIVVSGTDNVLIDNVVQVIDLSSLEGSDNLLADIVDEINSQRSSESGTLPGGWVAEATGNNLTFKTLHHGRDAKLLIKSDSTADALFGFDNLTAKGVSPSGVTATTGIETFGIVSGTTTDSSVYSLLLKAESSGIEGNQTQVKVVNNKRDGTFSLEVYNNGVQVESWGNLTKNSDSNLYVATYLPLVSDFILAEDYTDEAAPPKDGTYSLTGGVDGIPSDPDDQDDLLVGSDVASTGLFALSDPEQIDIDLIAIPGHPSTTVITAMLDFCQNYRMDCMAIVDPPFGLTEDESIDWQNGTHPLNTTRFDSDFGALYWPWVQIRDNFNKVDVWVPPSGSAMATIARSDFLGKPWYAPAGQTRGVVPGIKNVYNRPSLPVRDLMYGNNNCLNVIVQFPDVDGYIIMGQKTMQRTPTALDRINVRRLMFYIEKRIRTASRSLLFDPHDEVFRSKFITIATQILREVQVGRGVYDFIIQADEELNTPDVIDRNEFRARIGVQPVKAVEFMFLEFSVHRTGSFTENADTF